MVELQEKCKELDLDIIVIQESRLHKDQKDPVIPGYTLFRSDRKNKQGGGLLSYIRKSLRFEKNKAECKDGAEIQC